MAVAAAIERSSAEWEQLRAANSVLMLKEMLGTNDEQYQQEIYEQVCDQEFSHVPEVLDGETRTHFKFTVHGGKLHIIQPDGVVDWLAIHENGVDRARKKAEANYRLQFYADIAEAELEEAEAQQVMVASLDPATMLVISLDGSDLATAQELKKLGRDPEKRRAYLRLSVFENDELHLYSETYDGLTVDGAKQILQRFGVESTTDANSIDVLKSRVLLQGAHHDLLGQIAPSRGPNNYDFVLEQKDLMASHMKNLINLAAKNLPEAELACEADELRYDIMSSFKQRLEGTWDDLGGSLDQSIANAGLIERSQGTEYAGCDAVITNRPNLDRAGYWNTLQSELSRLITKHEFESKWCPNCLPKPKPGKKVKAWRQGDKIGCGNCGHEVDVCTKKTVRQGKKVKPAKP